MAYITQAEFVAYSPSTAIPTSEFSELAERAGDVIDEVTMFRIPSAGGLSTFSDSVQAAIKKAVCAQIQTMYAQGGVDAVIGNGSITGASIGKFSYQTDGRSGGQKINGIPVSPLVSTYLFRSGLLYRGLNQ